MTTLMDQIQDSTWFTKLDLKNGFNLIRVKEGDEWKTAFKTRYGIQEYGILPHSRTYYCLLFSLYHMFIVFVISY